MPDSNTTGTTTATGAGTTTTSTNGAAGTQSGAQGNNTVPITALHEEREKRQALAEEVAALKDQLGKLAAGSTQRQETRAQVVDNRQQQADQIDQLWRTDPKAAMRTELGMALDWADSVNMTVEEQADTIAGRKEYADFGTYRAEIMRHVRKLPLSQRGAPGVIETAYFLVKGRTADQIAGQKAAEAVTKYKTGEAAGAGQGAGGNAGGQSQSQQTGLSDQEKAVAAMMGMSEDDYLKHRKK